jgi:TonB family protein
MELHPLRGLEEEFEFVRELGRGGSSVVYLAVERELEREVAIKTIHPLFASDPDAAARLEREARTLARLEHPNIVTFYGVRRLADGGMAMVMQYVRGERLKDRIRAAGPLPFDEVRRVLADIARALGHAHRHHVVHRDIKPENIYLDSELGIARLSDFGIARAWDQDASLTQAGLTIGTPAYMAPEQIDGLGLDGRSDIYSLGLVGWEMLSGQRPWDGFNLYGIIYRQKNEALAAIDSFRPDVPQAIRWAVETALEKDPARRWPHAEAFLACVTADRDARFGAVGEPEPDTGAAGDISGTPTARPFRSPRSTGADASPARPVIDDTPTIPYRPSEVIDAGAAAAATAREDGPHADGPQEHAAVATAADAQQGMVPATTPTPAPFLPAAAATAAVASAALGALAAAHVAEAAGQVGAPAGRIGGPVEGIGDAPQLPPTDAPAALPMDEAAQAEVADVVPADSALPVTQEAPRPRWAIPATSDWAAMPPTGESTARSVAPVPARLDIDHLPAHDLEVLEPEAVPELLTRVQQALWPSGSAVEVGEPLAVTRERRRRLIGAAAVLALAVGSGVGAISLLHRRAADGISALGIGAAPGRVAGGTNANRHATSTPLEMAAPSSRSPAQLAALGSGGLPAPPDIPGPDLNLPKTAVSAPDVHLLGTPATQTQTPASAPAVAVSTPLPSAVALDAPLGGARPPTQADAGSTAPTDISSAPTFTPFAVAPRLINRERIAALLERVARERGESGHIVVWIFVNQKGVAQKTQVKQSSGHAALDSAALQVAANMRFAPALNGDQQIPVWVEVPIDVTSR